jgi:hypothetical protein
MGGKKKMSLTLLIFGTLKTTSNMEKEFIPYEQSLELKELGFDEPCFAFYNGKFLDFKIQGGDICSPYLSTENRGECPNAPTFSQTFRWFREKYGLWFRPDYYDEMKEYNFQGSIHELGKYSAISDIGNHKTAEEAELACLKKLIEIVKNK